MRRLVTGSEAEQGLERGHGQLPAIVAKDEFVEVNLELIAADTVVGSDQPLGGCQSRGPPKAPRISRLCSGRFGEVGYEAGV